MEKSWITTCTRLAAYLGLTADGIRRITKDEELLLHLVRCNAREAGADWRRECAKYKARLRHPAGRGCVDVWMFFRAFAPDLVDDDVELRRAVAGQPTWMKAADAGREYLVGARTLSKKTALGGFELGGLSFIRIRRTLLVRREEIESRWPRRDQLMRAGRGISRKFENPDSNGPRTGRVCGGGRFRFRHGMGCRRFGRCRRVCGRAGDGSASSESRWRFSPKSFPAVPLWG